MQIITHLFMAGQPLIKGPVGPGNGKIFFQLFQMSGKAKSIKSKQAFSGLPAPLVPVPEQTNGNAAALFSHEAGICITGQLSLFPLHGNPFRKTSKIPRCDPSPFPSLFQQAQSLTGFSVRPHAAELRETPGYGHGFLPIPHTKTHAQMIG